MGHTFTMSSNALFEKAVFTQTCCQVILVVIVILCFPGIEVCGTCLQEDGASTCPTEPNVTCSSGICFNAETTESNPKVDEPGLVTESNLEEDETELQREDLPEVDETDLQRELLPEVDETEFQTEDLPEVDEMEEEEDIQEVDETEPRTEPTPKVENTELSTEPKPVLNKTELSQNNLDCDNSQRGNNCSVPCPENCAGRICDNTTGECPKGCRAGYRGIRCQEVCEKGFYGDACTTECPSNCVRRDCHHEGGYCLHGCKEAYWGSDCSLTGEFKDNPRPEQQKFYSHLSAESKSILLYILMGKYEETLERAQMEITRGIRQRNELRALMA